MVVDVPQSGVEDVGLGHWVGGVGCWHEAFLARLDNCVVLTWSMVHGQFVFASFGCGYE